MASDTEQALVDAMAWFIAGEVGYGPTAGMRDQARELVAALRAALPEDVVLTRDGLARVERVGHGLWCGDELYAHDELYAREDEPPADPQDWFPLYTLTERTDP